MVPSPYSLIRVNNVICHKSNKEVINNAEILPNGLMDWVISLHLMIDIVSNFEKFEGENFDLLDRFQEY